MKWTTSTLTRAGLLNLLNLPLPKPARTSYALKAFTEKLNGIAQTTAKFDLRPGPGKDSAREADRANWCGPGRLLLRPAEPLEAQVLREQQRTGARVPTQKHGPVGLQPGTVRFH